MKKAMDKYHHTAVSKAKQANNDERDSAGEV
jgi:hypothetical protein